MALLNKLSDMAKNIGDKTSETVETAKLNSKISSEKNAIDGIYRKMGEHCYQQYKSGVSLPEGAAAFCAEIDKHNAAIDEANAEIERIKAQALAASAIAAGGVVCTSCSHANSPGIKFCQECGAKLEAQLEKPAPASGGGVCPSCGKALTPGNKFCQECGAKVEAPAKRLCSCGAEIVPGVKFCNECGSKIE
ncbi:MAG: zinc ribbon domain-containing protein [Treponema sp.]|nr:zinc ribbon domain-containing protein [Treponema sp.]